MASRHMVKDHSDNEKGNTLRPHRLLFPINSKGSFICTITTDRIIHTTAFVTPVVEHWLDINTVLTSLGYFVPLFLFGVWFTQVRL